MIQLKNEEIGISRIVGNKDSVVDHDEDGLMLDVPTVCQQIRCTIQRPYNASEVN